MNLDVGKTITVYASNLIEHYPLIQRSNGITMSSQVHISDIGRVRYILAQNIEKDG